MNIDPAREKLIRACMKEYPTLDRTLVELAIDFHERCEAKHGRKYKPEKILSKLKPVTIPKIPPKINPPPRTLASLDSRSQP